MLHHPTAPPTSIAPVGVNHKSSSRSCASTCIHGAGCRHDVRTVQNRPWLAWEGFSLVAALNSPKRCRAPDLPQVCMQNAAPTQDRMGIALCRFNKCSICGLIPRTDLRVVQTPHLVP
ncbi:hypothetical protein M8818_003788 [Zalaria obscura]|uniref:Uncharacterized protein n=1 Tax=Zalaria obscura TaxID=2024903 RepID=A0ACC3SHU3_9PEZI